VYHGGHVVFKTEPEIRPAKRKFFIFVGGLSDGLMATNYVAPLAEALTQSGWTFLQPLISSSYTGFGTNDLNIDAKEISELVGLIRKDDPKAPVIFMGHSTGCQDAVTYCRKYHNPRLKSYGPSLKFDAVVLQAPVSDRESMMMDEENVERRSRAARMVAEGKGMELMPSGDYWAPITSYRFNSLCGKMTDDDMFSSDLKDGQLKEKLDCVDVPALLIFSGSDEYVPKTVDTKLLAKRMKDAMKSEDVEAIILDGADHAASSPDSVAALVNAVSKFLTPRF